MADTAESGIAAAYIGVMIDKEAHRIVNQSVHSTVGDLKDVINEWRDIIGEDGNDADKYAIDWTVITEQELEEE